MTSAPADREQKRTPRSIFIALSGLVMGMFVAVLSGTVVSTSLPRVIAELGGNQASYTWVVTASLLATAVSTPIWGKLSDLLNRKLLLQLSLGLFSIGTIAAGFAQDTGTLIAFRVVQGIGTGGLMSLVFVVIALLISPRERGKYMGVVGGIMAVATIGGPLLGGIITDTLGWRFNFFVSVPFAVAAIIIIQKTLFLPRGSGRKVSIDFVGAALLAIGVSLLLVWVSMGGSQFEWNSVQSYLMIGGSILALLAFVFTEFVVAEPIVPMALFKNRTFTLAVISSVGVGVAMFSTSVFLAQYFQLARGANPTESGLMTIPMIVGQMGASILIGQLISRLGKWKIWMVTGSALVVVGVSLMSTLSYDTPFIRVSVFMVILGAGMGMVMQNLTLVVQNDTPAEHLGTATSNVNFFRSVAGAIGVTVMGSILASQVSSHLTTSLGSFVPSSAEEVEALKGLATGTVPDVSALPATIRVLVESAYGAGIADSFLVAIPMAVLGLLAVIFLPNKALSTKTANETLAETAEEVAIDLAEAEVGAATTDSGTVAGTPAHQEKSGDR